MMRKRQGFGWHLSHEFLEDRRLLAADLIRSNELSAETPAAAHESSQGFIHGAQLGDPPDINAVAIGLDADDLIYPGLPVRAVATLVNLTAGTVPDG